MVPRFARPAVLSALVALALAPSAMAASVTREPLALPDVVEDSSCGFTVLVTFPVNQQIVTSRFDADGNEVAVVITGRLVATFTNPDTGATVTANISGPSRVDRNGAFYYLGVFSGPDLAGHQGILIFAGRLNNDTGEFTGHVRASVCELLAPAV